MFALLLDIGYQIYVLHFVYPGEAITVAIVLALLPYLILRGLPTALIDISICHPLSVPVQSLKRHGAPFVRNSDTSPD